MQSPGVRLSIAKTKTTRAGRAARRGVTAAAVALGALGKVGKVGKVGLCAVVLLGAAAGARADGGGSSLPLGARAPATVVHTRMKGVDGQPGLGQHGRLLGQVHGGQLEEPVAVVGHHHLDR